MQATESPSLAARQLQRLVNIQASAEAAAALHRAATGARVLALADAVLRDANDLDALARLRDAVVSPKFLSSWIAELREVASLWPDSGACTLASAFELWSFTVKSFGGGETQIADELAETFVSLAAARALVLEVISDGPKLRRDLAFVYAAESAAAAGTTCAAIVFGYRRHLTWDAEGCASCYGSEQLDDLEALMPGIASAARIASDVVEADGSHAAKRGPCATFGGVETFMRLRNRLDACLTGSRLAKDRAAAALRARS